MSRQSYTHSMRWLQLCYLVVVLVVTTITHVVNGYSIRKNDAATPSSVLLSPSSLTQKSVWKANNNDNSWMLNNNNHHNNQYDKRNQDTNYDMNHRMGMTQRDIISMPSQRPMVPYMVS